MRTFFLHAASTLTLAAVLVPQSAHARTFAQIVDQVFVPTGDLIITLLYGVAFIFFLFGMFRYFFVSGEAAEEARTKGKQHMLWGIIGLVVLFSVWGLVRILLNLLTEWSV